ncbi:DUF4232 domain-containing protein [Streptomyces sp. NPDC048639]|uniref:DUF4232 domain-containing protein n=1 Tax=Streptomyces sp. NPDC048639 TaxID=3365581 RepID=UPI0037114258
MPMRALTAAAGAALLATLTLTACGSEDSGDASGGGRTTSSLPSDDPEDSEHSGDNGKGPTTSGPGATVDTDTSTGGSGDDGGAGTGGYALVSCTTNTTEVKFLASAANATDAGPAKGTVLVRNISSAPCTLSGATTLTAKDDQDRHGSVSTDNAAAGPYAIDIPAHGQVSAVVGYLDSVFDGKGKGAVACAVKASEVEIALPEDEARGVQVTEENGDPAHFTVCAPRKVTFGAFKR